MNDRQLSDRIGNVDEALVEAAAGQAPKRGRVWTRFAAAAAALALIAGGAALALRGGTPADGPTPTGGPDISTNRPAQSLASGDLMEGVSPRIPADPGALTEENAALIGEFGLRLLRACDDGGNALISPYSVLSALGMAALGARGETLAEMSAVLGADPEALGACLRALGESLPGETVSIANAIWFNQDSRFHAEPAFLQKNADTYYAGVHAAPFDDGALRDINAWVNESTHGMIPEILDQIPKDALMYLLNALAFEARWRQPYEWKDKVLPAVFHAGSGEKRDITMMYGDMEGYLEDENAQGFLKYYEGGRFAFAALLPDEGVSVEEYLASLTGEKLRALLSSAGNDPGSCGIPKFTLEWNGDLSGALSALGMPTAFDRDSADFSGLGNSVDGNVFLSRVLHETFLEVAEDGTRAAAATAVEAVGDSASDVVLKTVYLDRPFICLIVDTDTYTPLFLALVRDIGA